MAQNLRFGFGDNWKRYLSSLTENKVEAAKQSLVSLFDGATFSGNTFLDVGSGSGLFSLAARQLGASVRSFDYDLSSVECAEALKSQYFPESSDWVISQGSVLDQSFLSELKKSDFVYSWGVLHHTGEMWQALDNVAGLVKPSGLLCVSIYNDQGWISSYWKTVKRVYNLGPAFAFLMLASHFPYYFARLTKRVLSGQFKLERGMDLWTDYVDWIGGYPFEVATPKEIGSFFEKRGFTLVKSHLRGRRHGCNEFLFQLV